MLVPSAIHAKSRVRQNAESSRNPRCSRVFNAKITHSISRRPKIKSDGDVCQSALNFSSQLEWTSWAGHSPLVIVRRTMVGPTVPWPHKETPSAMAGERLRYGDVGSPRAFKDPN